MQRRSRLLLGVFATFCLGLTLTGPARGAGTGVVSPVGSTAQATSSEGQLSADVGVDCDSLVCDDGNPCTNDTCDPALGCVYTYNAASCDDGNACTSGDVCIGGICQSGAPVSCNDSRQCTDDSCDPASGCVHTNNTEQCSDGNACTVGDTCSGGACLPGGPRDCNDGNICSVDACSAITGCYYQPSGLPCDDGNPCTFVDLCDGYSCRSGFPVTCNDDNACTADSCNPATGCVHSDASCNDSNACTADSCDPVTGCAHVSASCVDSNPCTNDSCNPATGCVFANNTAPCDDADACTTGETCGGGTCHAGAPISCNDANGCTTDSCNPATGCAHVNNTVACNDGNFCTTGDVCGGGVCHPGGPTSCDDHNACTNDSCSLSIGCVFTNSTAACNDGNACTDDGCNPASGCFHTDNIAPCNDGNACTANDACSGGACAGVAITVPSEVTNLRFDADHQTMSWSTAAIAGPGTTHDVVRGLESTLPVGAGAVTCLQSGLAEATASDPQVPATDQTFWYLVRGKNTCGTGTYGSAASHGVPTTPRTTTACP